MSSNSAVQANLIDKNPKPVLKWAGGKQAIASALVAHFPSKFTRYYEPFFGGGSVFFKISAHKAVIGDLNEWLLGTYQAIRDDWTLVASELDKLINTKEEFLRIRAVAPDSLTLHQRAAHFIYLNKTCFRGLFRVNQKGQFNVPYGAYERRYYCPENLELVSNSFQQVEFRKGDFEECVNGIKKSDFAYFDPPYYKLGGYSDFNRYTAGQFREDDHIRLASLCKSLDSKGVRWAVSNSETPFIRELFAGFEFIEVIARREINLNSSNREVRELLIRNY
jgi:DNA adenine methylase